MMTIVTHVHLKEGAGREWDTAMRTRLSAAKKRLGWVGGQLLRQSDRPDRRVIVGTWRTREDWEAWHQDPQFAETRRRLEGLEGGPAEHWWHEVDGARPDDPAVTPAPGGSGDQVEPKEANMGNPTSYAWILVGVGVLLVLISALADSAGLGRSPGFGWRQGLGVAIGVLVILGGLYKRHRQKPSL